MIEAGPRVAPAKLLEILGGIGDEPPLAGTPNEDLEALAPQRLGAGDRVVNTAADRHVRADGHGPCFGAARGHLLRPGPEEERRRPANVPAIPCRARHARADD